jgi:radical SAM superfamily enzyme YgiQ (UPF0313 family)
MKILLVYPNSTSELIGWGDLGAIAEPLALEYLAAAALGRGDEVNLLDLRLHPLDLYSRLLEYDPDVVGITGYSMHVMRMIELCREVRWYSPRATILVGGHHATLAPDDFKVDLIDYIVVGEGVRPLLAILESLEEGKVRQRISGAWSRQADNTFEYGGDQQPWNADDLPYPSRNVVKSDRNNYYIDWMKPIALLRTTVGCPYRCSFCSLWKLMDGLYDKREVDNVVGELREISEPYVFLIDDEPFIDGKRMRVLAEAIKNAGIEKEYFAYCRIDSFLRNIELMVQWRIVGLRRLFFGIEAVFDSELDGYNKRLHIRDVEKALGIARNLGIQIFSSFIVKPSYSQREFSGLAEFIIRNNVEYRSFTILTPIPGTTTDFSGVIDSQSNGRPNWR